MNQRDVLSIMMMQQQQRQQQQQSQHQQQPGRPQHQVNGSTHNNGRDVPLADQISNMAIDPLNLEPLVHRRHPNSNSADFDDDDDSSNAKSINSCISYDGKCTTIFASRSRTHDQELACHALNTAICDIYGAPVGRILRQYPMVTRLIRADDETGNVQLHYAVRNGNVKAIRRIVRSDIGCALIRNIQVRDWVVCLCVFVGGSRERFMVNEKDLICQFSSCLSFNFCYFSRVTVHFTLLSKLVTLQLSNNSVVWCLHLQKYR